jgi:hypothetical protein
MILNEDVKILVNTTVQNLVKSISNGFVILGFQSEPEIFVLIFW